MFLWNSTAFTKWEENIALFSTNLCLSDPSHELRNDNESDFLDSTTEHNKPTIQPDLVGHPEQDYELTHTINQQSALDLIVAHPA
eukprot:10687799-Ditylum_brightwellii.AAC.1